jgi:hypothetical protein
MPGLGWMETLTIVKLCLRLFTMCSLRYQVFTGYSLKYSLFTGCSFRVLEYRFWGSLSGILVTLGTYICTVFVYKFKYLLSTLYGRILQK